VALPKTRTRLYSRQRRKLAKEPLAGEAAGAGVGPTGVVATVQGKAEGVPAGAPGELFFGDSVVLNVVQLTYVNGVGRGGGSIE